MLSPLKAAWAVQWLQVRMLPTVFKVRWLQWRKDRAHRRWLAATGENPRVSRQGPVNKKASEGKPERSAIAKFGGARLSIKSGTVTATGRIR